MNDPSDTRVTPLKGYTRPFSTDGSASVLPPFPYDFSIKASMVHYRTDPEALERLLPPPMRLLPSRRGEAFWLVIDHVMTPVDVPSEDWSPERRRMLEGTICMPVELDGEPGMFYVLAWTDREWSFLMEWLTGISGKLARISVSEHHALHDALPGRKPGSSYRATVERLGSRIAESVVTLEEQVRLEDTPIADLFNVFIMRHIPNLDLDAGGRPLAFDICKEVTDVKPPGQIWKGTGTVRFHDVENEENMPVAPHECIAGYHLEMAFRSHGIRVVHDLLPAWDAAAAADG